MESAEEIYKQAQKELALSSKWYGKAYDIRRHINRYGGTSAFSAFQIKAWKEEIALAMKEQAKCRRKYRSLMKKISWDPKKSEYRLKTPAEKKAEASRRK